jgi:L-alanine-DL-glutamate epimerase-like enolase superfamily enzyme
MIHGITGVRVYFLPVVTRVPLKFGLETLTSVTCARVALRVVDERGNQAEGWGETPLSVQWVWPSAASYQDRHEALKRFCITLVQEWARFQGTGHPLEAGHSFLSQALPAALATFNARPKSAGGPPEPVPYLAALVCNSPFDIALHDAFGKLVGKPIYETYNREFLGRDLAAYLEPAPQTEVSFRSKFPADFLSPKPALELPAWHLVGGLDLLERDELTGAEPQDGHPVVLTDWVERDGLKCLKVKLRGNDAEWDYQRLVRVGQIAAQMGVECLSADFNCTVKEPVYVNEVLDRLRKEQPRIFEMLLYVEQPFPYELEEHRLDVRSVSARKPLFLDESAHDWRLVRLGRELGWTGVALKTCKTQTGAILSACWAKAHGMSLMVQDLTNPMLAQIPHCLLAAHVGTIKGVETNSMQFYPAASEPEAKVHPGLYQRREGKVRLSSVRGPGFGYRIEEIQRELPEPQMEV